MKKNEDFLYAMGFVAAFALVMATPAFAEKVISHTSTTCDGNDNHHNHQR